LKLDDVKAIFLAKIGAADDFDVPGGTTIKTVRGEDDSPFFNFFQVMNKSG